MGEESEREVVCEIVLEFPTEEHASKVLHAVETDNEGFVLARLEGAVMKATIEAESLKSLLHTLDDFLACVSVAHKVVSG